jgi:RimJ/RimL family protein N-acetyltransferase
VWIKGNGLVALRDLHVADLDVVFDWGQDPEAVHMAAFTNANLKDRAGFDAHWDRILADTDIVNRAIIVDEVLVGTIASFTVDGDREITYWIDRAQWGRGIASTALALFLLEDKARPLYGRAASDNTGSIRVLERNRFREIGRQTGFAQARGRAIEETIFLLDAVGESTASV